MFSFVSSALASITSSITSIKLKPRASYQSIHFVTLPQTIQSILVLKPSFSPTTTPNTFNYTQTVTMVYSSTGFSSENLNTTSTSRSQVASPATSIRWGATPSPSMYSPRASLEIMRTPGGIPVMARRSLSQADIAAEKSAKKQKKEKKESKNLMAKIKKSLDKNTADYWSGNGMNIHYSGVFSRV